MTCVTYEPHHSTTIQSFTYVICTYVSKTTTPVLLLIKLFVIFKLTENKIFPAISRL